jgi:hypothetical protein
MKAASQVRTSYSIPPDAPEPVQDAWAELDSSGKLAIEAHGAVKAAKNAVVNHVRGDTDAGGNDTTIRQDLRGNPIKFLPLATMWAEVVKTVTTTPAGSELGRLAQLLKAAGLTATVPVAPAVDLPISATDES